MQGEFWPDTGPTSDDGTTCGPFRRMWPTPNASVANLGETPETWDARRERVKKTARNGNGMGNQLTIEVQRGMSILSPAASHARTSATPEREPDSLASEADCGTSSPVSFASFDPDMCSWRTSQLCLLGGWMPYSERWPRSGMMRNGIAYRLRPLVPRISGTVCSLWPTPSSAKAANDLTLTCSGDGRDKPNKLGWAVARYPSPSATDHKDSSHPGQRRGQLSEAIEPTANSGTTTQRMILNPAWVEWLQGFPVGWTEV
jgi:hypothetical protein